MSYRCAEVLRALIAHPEQEGGEMTADFVQITTTAPTKSTAQAIAGAITERRLAACVQIVGPITSTYWWQEDIETAQEWLCVIKSRNDLYGEIEQEILKLHPYETPEILVTPVIEGNARYLAWIDESIAR
jgi:periplasmic divalent cation tolerance protein